jgi:signal peptide peptidase SppA
MAGLGDRLGAALAKEDIARFAAFSDDAGFDGPGRERPGFDVVAGVAVIAVEGVLVQKSGYVRPTSGLTGYDGLRQNLMGALSDPAVKAIMFDMNSGGGEVSGCFDFADTVYAARGIKPIWAICADHAYSAAYAIASACDYITVPRTGGTGSCGVICLHCDMSRALEKAGISVTVIQYGARKADGSETQPLSDPALARFQNDVNTMGDLFVETVARNRDMAVAKVKGTEASTYLGASGVSVGFADAVMAPDEAFRRLLSQLG